MGQGPDPIGGSGMPCTHGQDVLRAQERYTRVALHGIVMMEQRRRPPRTPSAVLGLLSFDVESVAKEWMVEGREHESKGETFLYCTIEQKHFLTA